MSNKFVGMSNVDGRITPTGEACVPVLDRGFLYGDSIYEVFRTYSGVPLFYQEHWKRLENSARLIHMHISQSREEITEQIRRTVEAGVRMCTGFAAPSRIAPIVMPAPAVTRNAL